jgi:hypothetical protein
MASAGFEPAILGTRVQHANHQTTEAALYRDCFIFYHLSPDPARQIYLTERLHSPRHAVTAAKTRSAIKEILFVYFEW